MIRGAQLSRAIAVYPRAGDRIPRISVRLHPTPPTRSSRGPAAYFPKLCRRPDLFVSKSLSLSAPIGVLTSVGLTAGKRGARTRFRISLIPAPAQSRAAVRSGMLVRLGRWPKLAPRDVDTIAVEHEVSGTSLIVTLPQHALAVAPRAAPPTVPPPPGRKVDVTGKFFDDPKPDKAALRAGVRGSR